MKYIIGILIGAVAISAILTIGIYAIFGATPGYFFAKFIAAPVSLLGAGFGFLVYDALWPKKKPPGTRN